MTNIDERKKQRIQFFKNDQLRHENFKYGELIIQTNKVQWYLTYIIFLRASRPTKKLEKYLELPTTKKMLVLPYPHAEDIKVFEFVALPRFFEYLKHKKSVLGKRNTLRRTIL